MDNFKTLPYELQSKILRSDKLLKPSSLRMNKAIYDASLYQIYDDECEKPITPQELTNYIKNYNPILVGKFYFDKEGDWWKYVAFIHYYGNNTDINVIQSINTTAIVLEHPYQRYYGPIVLGNVELSSARDIFITMTEANRTNPFEYDLMTMYYIYSDRTSCMNINANYAKDKVLDLFDNLRFINYEDQLVFLRTNAKIMGINVKGFDKVYQAEYKNGFITDDNIINKIETEVELLEKLILKRLQCL